MRARFLWVRNTRDLVHEGVIRMGLSKLGDKLKELFGKAQQTAAEAKTKGAGLAEQA
jgi:hypothetical protein